MRVGVALVGEADEGVGVLRGVGPREVGGEVAGDALVGGVAREGGGVGGQGGAEGEGEGGVGDGEGEEERLTADGARLLLGHGKGRVGGGEEGTESIETRS